MKSLILFFCICNLSVKCQTKNYKITYKHCIEFDTTKSLRSPLLGGTAILVGNNIESNYSFFKKVKDTLNKSEKSLKQIFSEKQSGSFLLKPKFNGDSMGNIVYYNKVDKKLLVREKMYEEYILTEEKDLFINWIINDSVKVIKNYKCQLATCNFRGRNYQAWFTTEIGIIAAPWKFFGLPGLIMEIKDYKNQVNIYVEKIEYPSFEKVNKFYFNGKKISIKEYFSYRKKEFDKQNKAIQAMLDNQPHMKEIIASGEKPPILRTSGIPYGIEIKEN